MAIIGFIRDAESHLKGAFDRQPEKEEIDPRKKTKHAIRPKDKMVLDGFYRLYKAIFRCLINFCHGNPSNQDILHKNLDLFMKLNEIDFG